MVDFEPLSRSTIGFDRLFNLLENGLEFGQTQESYPPYDIEKTGDDAYRITMAVAGFAPEELSITSEPNLLSVAGKKAQNGEGEYLHQGIARRAFRRQFSLADYVRVAGARLQDGMLSIDLVRELPEAMKPRRIEIASSDQPFRIESRAAA
jgi:molecular chaperone IbpA